MYFYFLWLYIIANFAFLASYVAANMNGKLLKLWNWLVIDWEGSELGENQ